jgi:hypothetical protein
MKQNRITKIILAGIILAGLVICAVIGYLNDSGRTSPNFGLLDEPLFTETPNAIDLVYCYNPVDLCIISFGQDSSGNLLIVIRNNIPGLKEFYAKLKPVEALEPNPTEVSNLSPTETLDPNLAATPSFSPTESPSPEPTKTSELYTCQKVQFASDVYYCMGSLIPDGTMVIMDVYSKSDDRLVASGRIPVSAEATPAPLITETPSTFTAEPINTEVFTVTPESIKTATPTALPSSTVITPAYSYP